CSLPNKGPARRLGQVVPDVAEAVLQLPLQEDHRGESRDRDDSDDERVLNEALSLVVAEERSAETWHTHAGSPLSSTHRGPSVWVTAARGRASQACRLAGVSMGERYRLCGERPVLLHHGRGARAQHRRLCDARGGAPSRRSLVTRVAVASAGDRA